MIVWIIVGLVAFVVLVFVVAPAFEGYLDFKNKPREPMEWCPRGHGHFRKKDCIEWSPGQLICPQCWIETMQGVEAKK